MSTNKKYDNIFGSDTDTYQREPGSNKWVASKQDYDLFDETKNTVNKLYRIKVFGTKKDNKKWKIYEDNKVIFVLPASKLLNYEIEFLQKLEGVSFLIEQAKLGIKSLNSIRRLIKDKLTK